MMVGETSYHFDMSEYHVISKKQDQKMKPRLSRWMLTDLFGAI